MWEQGRVQRYAIVTVVIGGIGAVLLGLSFGTTSWLVFPPGHFYLPTHRLYMGLFGDKACIDEICGAIPTSQIRRDTTYYWNSVLGLMCTSLAVTLMALAMNIMLIIMPKKMFAIYTSLFWLLAGAMNLISVVTFWCLFKVFEARISWSCWVSMVSTIILIIVGLALSVFSCCHRWTKIKSYRSSTHTVAPSPGTTHGATPGGDTAWVDDAYSIGSGMAHNSKQTGYGSSQSYQI